MEEDKKKKLSILGILLLLLLIGGLIYFFFFYNTAPAGEGDQEGDTPGQGQTELPESKNDPEGGQREEVETSPEDYNFSGKKELGENDLKKMASSFAERFGSYTSHSGFGNIEDLRIFMSDSMEEWANGFVEDQVEEETEDNDFYGISTRAASTQVTEFDKDSGRAVVMVETQRTETKDDEKEVFPQAIEITFAKEGSEWKVNRAEWQ